MQFSDSNVHSRAASQLISSYEAHYTMRIHSQCFDIRLGALVRAKRLAQAAKENAVYSNMSVSSAPSVPTARKH